MSHRHASESWHPAFVAAHADIERDPSFRSMELGSAGGMTGTVAVSRESFLPP